MTAIMSAYVSENIGGHFTSLYLGDKHENGHLHRSISTTYEISLTNQLSMTYEHHRYHFGSK